MAKLSGTIFSSGTVVYDDSVMISPTAKLYMDDVDDVVMLWDEIMQVGISIIMGQPTAYQITLIRPAWDAIVKWAEAGGYGGMELHTYLNKMFTNVQD
jgi:hypothetical protein